MFSRRTGWDLEPNRLHTALAAHRASGRPLLDLTVATPSAAGLPWPDPEGLRAALTPEELNRYRPEPFGSPAARSMLRGWLAQRGVDLPIAQLCLTASTSEAYAFLFKLLADPGDAVLVPTPSYPLFDDLAGLEGVSVVPYQLRYDGEWHLGAGALDAALAAAGARAKAIVALHPNNPTGHFLKPDELALLGDRCGREGLALIVDEVFAQYPLGEGRRPADPAAADAQVLTFSLGGLSKLVGLPQLKLSWIAANGPAGQLNEALARLEIVADTYLSVSSPAQLALPYLLDQASGRTATIGARLKHNLAVLDRALEAAPTVSRLRCEGGWLALLRLPAWRDSEGWALAALAAGVLTQPGYFYGLDAPDAYLALSLLTPEAAWSAGLAAVLALAVA